MVAAQMASQSMHEAQLHMMLWLGLFGCIGAAIIWVYEK